MTSKNCTHSKSTIYILLIAEKKMYFLNFLPYDRTVLAVQFCKKKLQTAWLGKFPEAVCVFDFCQPTTDLLMKSHPIKKQFYEKTSLA